MTAISIPTDALSTRVIKYLTSNGVSRNYTDVDDTLVLLGFSQVNCCAGLKMHNDSIVFLDTGSILDYDQYRAAGLSTVIPYGFDHITSLSLYVNPKPGHIIPLMKDLLTANRPSDLCTKKVRSDAALPTYVPDYVRMVMQHDSNFPKRR